MKRRFDSLLCVAFVLAWAGAGRADDANSSSCVRCHAELNPAQSAIVEGCKQSIHGQRGIGCEDCHGGDPKVGYVEGDPTLAMDPAKGYRGAPTPQQIPAFCGRCHSDVDFMKNFNPRLRVDQEQQYRTSRHAKQLALGDTLVATCVSCHGAHGILPPNDSRSPVNKMNVPHTCAHCHGDPKRMGRYHIPTDQFAQYERSVHGELLLVKGDRSAPSCADCHGNHGATPPGLGSVAQVCGECHANNRDLFDASPHAKAFAEKRLPGCVTCHGNHGVAPTSDALLGVGDGSFCIRCHSDANSPAYQEAAKMRAAVDTLKASIARADTLVGKAERAGLDVGQPKFELKSAADRLVMMRSLIHSASLDKITPESQAGLATSAQVSAKARALLRDVRVRQYGLAGSGLLILILVVLLRLKIREVDRRTPA